MSAFHHSIKQQDIVRKYFSDPKKKILLKKNDVLLRQNERNEKIFFVKEGKLDGYIPDMQITEPVFEAPASAFVGVYSYLSEDRESYSEVVATQPSLVYYFDEDFQSMRVEESEELFSFLFGIVVLELRSRQRFAAQMAQERQEATNKLIKTEKLITLGQLATGLAHELNNSIGSLSSNLGQLQSDVWSLLIKDKSNRLQEIFQKGLKEGQQLSTSEARKERSTWPSSLHLSRPVIKILTKAGISPTDIQSREEAIEAATLWDMGYMLHDMKIATQQASHVISSIKTMGISNQRWSEEVDVNTTIEEAVAILSNLTKRIKLEIDLTEELSSIEAYHGELVQVWVNLVKNAVESLLHHQVADPLIRISSEETKLHIIVEVEDNGIGIDPSIKDKIYEPNFTTKVEGLSLGLGLGLTIVQRIVSEHEGEIEVDSRPGRTCFKIMLKKRKSN